jgi:hypothetical protein
MPTEPAAPVRLAPPASRAKAVYVATLLVVLAGVQVRAQLGQWAAGFRPFAHAPTRVPYSWDMFAIRINRCAVRWDPPLSVEGARVARWSDRTAPIEFDTVYNDVRSYAAVATAACGYRTAPETVMTLQCFLSDGGTGEYASACP